MVSLLQCNTHVPQCSLPMTRSSIISSTASARSGLHTLFLEKFAKYQYQYFYFTTAAKDFIAIEIARGNLHFIFDLGNGAQILQSAQPYLLSDKTWHSVRIHRPKRSEYTLLVDGNLYQAATPVRDKSKLDLSGKLHLGGIPKSDFALLPRTVVSRHGFMGCLRELSLNGRPPELAAIALEQPAAGVVPGCVDGGKECRVGSCQNGGRCEHQGNGVLCDCDMTSYSGPVCTDCK